MGHHVSQITGRLRVVSSPVSLYHLMKLLEHITEQLQGPTVALVKAYDDTNNTMPSRKWGAFFQ